MVDNPFFARVWPVVATHEAEAIRAYELQLKGHDLEYISKALGLAPRTIQRRISELILARERPSREVLRWIESDRLDRWLTIIGDRLDDEASHADAARLIAQAVSISTARRRLYGLDDQPDANAASVVPALPAHLREAAQRADDDLAQREAEIRARTEGA